MQAAIIRDALTTTAGVQSVGAIEVHDRADGGSLVAVRLGFGPSTPAADIVLILATVRTRIGELVPGAVDIVLEPEIAAPRSDANPPTDVFVIRGAD